MTAPAKSRRKAATKRRVEPVQEPDDVLDEPGPPGTEDDDGEVRPVIIGKGRRGDQPLEQVKIFEIDGVDYHIPKEPSAGLVIQYLIDIRERGRAIAVESVALTLLGRENMAALAATPEVAADDVSEVFRNVGMVFFGSQTYNAIIDSAGN